MNSNGMTTTESNRLLTDLPNHGSQSLAMAHTQSQAVALASAVSAVLDRRILTAKQFPRSIARFKQEAIGLLSEDIDTARSAEYAKPVGGGSVKGPSVRLTEIACLCWTNIEVDVQEPIVSERSVTVQAFAWDLERNIRVPGIATASIVRSDGVTRYPQHLIETTVIATASKARRNAILAVIPRAYINDLLEAAREVANRNEKPIEQARVEMLGHFERSYRVTKEQVLAYLAVEGIEDITLQHIEELRAVFAALREGENPEGFFGKSKSLSDLAKEKVAARRAKADGETKQQPQPEGEAPSAS